MRVPIRAALCGSLAGIWDAMPDGIDVLTTAPASFQVWL